MSDMGMFQQLRSCASAGSPSTGWRIRTVVILPGKTQTFNNRSLSGYNGFVDYSERNTLIGFIDIARRAGK